MRRSERRADHERRMNFRQIPPDPLTLDKLKEFHALWSYRLENKEYAEETCKRMIHLYEIRIGRIGG